MDDGVGCKELKINILGQFWWKLKVDQKYICIPDLLQFLIWMIFWEMFLIKIASCILCFQTSLWLDNIWIWMGSIIKVGRPNLKSFPTIQLHCKLLYWYFTVLKIEKKVVQKFNIFWKKFLHSTPTNAQPSQELLHSKDFQKMLILTFPKLPYFRH